MIKVIVIAILFFSPIVALQIFIYRTIVRNAIRKYIEPKLQLKGLFFIDYKWPGLFSDGDFEDTTLTLLIMNKNGNASNSTYAYIFYKDGNETKKITARIDTTFWTIYNVIYSSDF